MKHRTLNVGRFALTGVALAASCLIASSSWALGLGRLSVQSALGESLRAEVEVTSITNDEAGTLQLRVAGAEVYRAAGIDYNAVLPTTQVVLQRRPDGRSVFRLTSDRAVNEPFLDVILEANWASGRLVRAYTLLLDPPQTRRPEATVAAAPTMTPAAPAPTPAAPVAAAPVRPAPAVEAAPAPKPQPAAKTVQPAGERAERYRVRGGDTLSGIASANLPSGVSLDQMLVALFRANPKAFINSNMNRLMAGAVLELPSADVAGRVDGGDARQVIQAQSADFSAYRQRLASNVGSAATEAPSRQAAGKVQTMVEDRKATAAATPDKLTLSQGAVKASEAESRASKAAEKKDAAARVAELTRNVEELKKLQSGATSAPTVPAAVTAPAVAAAASPVVTAMAPAPAPVVATEPVAASAPDMAPPAASAVAAAPAAPVTMPPAAEEPGVVASLLDNPLVLPGAGVLVALLVGLGLYRLRGRMRKPGGETSFFESRMQPDSFFGASGGQRIDTRESTTGSSSSSMSYSLSQLDAIGDVDPVAEADVYLAYGRDLQAEEILKEAMRVTPDRQAIRIKLLEVYAKRRDTKGLEMLAVQVYSMTKGEGEDWAKAQEIGRSVDADNPLYQPGGLPQAVMMQGGEMIEPLGASTMPASVKPASSLQGTQGDLPGKKTLDLGLDLDLDLDTPDAITSTDSGLSPVESTQPLRNIDTQPPLDSISFDLPDLPETVPTKEEGLPLATSDFGALDFDLGDSDEPASGLSDSPMSGDKLPDFAPSTPPSEAQISDFGDINRDPLERKLELAEEFRQIGDSEGARDLLEEVIAKATGALKTKAQGMLDRLA